MGADKMEYYCGANIKCECGRIHTVYLAAEKNKKEQK